MNRPEVWRLSKDQFRALIAGQSKHALKTWGGDHQAAVLIPLAVVESQWHLLFTERTDQIATHKGQISFPGGRAEPVDASPEETALRETCEEIGLGREMIQVAGRLGDFVTHYGVVITPVAGFIQWPAQMTLSDEEVKRVFTIPLAWFAAEENAELRLFTDPEGVQRRVLFYREYQGNLVWGITAHIIQNFIQTLQK